MENDKPNLFSVTVQEAFEFGKLEGQKETLKEVKELSDVDPKFIGKYCDARLKSINDNTNFLAKIKRSLS